MTLPGFRPLHRTLATAVLGGCALMAAPSASAQLCVMVLLQPAFAGYDPSGVDRDATGSLTLTCTAITAPLAYTIQFGFSAQSSGSQRRMRLLTDATKTLDYNFYCDTGYSLIWGDGTGTPCAHGTATALANVRIHTIYGRIPRAQFVPTGSYQDNVAVTVLY